MPDDSLKKNIANGTTDQGFSALTKVTAFKSQCDQLLYVVTAPERKQQVEPDRPDPPSSAGAYDQQNIGKQFKNN